MALVLVVLFLPIILFTAILIRLTSRGPAFYLQTRVGKGGRLFKIYKLRTMYHNVERTSGACWSVAGDPRVTSFGRFLRTTHIDELPQLFNVLRGQMSLVGPRPERPEFVAVLEREIPRYRDRLLVRPGVTGLAQVYLPPDTDLDSVRRKLVYDLAYIGRMSFWLDIRLMICTGLRIFGVPLSFLARLLWLPATQVIENTHPPHGPHSGASLTRQMT
jgi:lipopolysaccharide/colanic/teichoic acid biosynthesis glycosyltransferase